MSAAKIGADLNARQRDAVTLDDDKNALVLAGAGSGKTRVLIDRAAYLVAQKNIKTENILAVTFTNKAADEMARRLEVALRRPSRGMWVGTFHSICHRMLRRHSEAAGLPADFQIIDSQDQLRIIKRLMKDLGTNDNFEVKKIQWFINHQKDDGVRADAIDAQANYFVQVAGEIYAAYEAFCGEQGLVDFSELLLRVFEMLKNHADIRAHYQRLFRHILIDEFQDTNGIQYALVQALFSGENRIFCVGDDDQSIYSFRGARVENIQKMQTDFAPLAIIRLEQNYRSTGTILNAANALIEHNKNRLGKTLWTESAEGEAIDYFVAEDEEGEAHFVAEKIIEATAAGASPSQCAVLYRSNAQSRAFEKVFNEHQIPYEIYGGLRFFERAEVKDALSYLRLVENPGDNEAFLRIVNVPKRGIGAQSVAKISAYANEHRMDFLSAASETSTKISSRARHSLSDFAVLITQMHEATTSFTLGDKVEYIVHSSGLWDFYCNDKNDKAESRCENLKELINSAANFRADENNENYENEENDNLDETAAFITFSSLDKIAKNATTKPAAKVKLMTVHAAKGLEFSEVFLVGLEENLFPSIRSKEAGLLDEERRLCYVGMTRAMKKLHLSLAKKRRGFFTRPSCFLKEIPTQYLYFVNRKINRLYMNFETENSNEKIIENSNEKTVENPNQETAEKTIHIGAAVRHQTFGFGTVLSYDGSRVKIHFQNYGTKWLVANYANLEIV